MKYTRIVFLLCALAGTAGAQLLDIGVKAGVPMNDAIKAAQTFKSEFARWTLGPMVEVNLPKGFGVEADMLFRTTGYSEMTKHTGLSFEFPVLVKYKFPGENLRPYLAFGYSFRHITDIPRLFESNSDGTILGVGLRVNAKLVKIAPEIRYTRWNNNVFGGEPARLGLSSSRNQMEFLIGVTF